MAGSDDENPPPPPPPQTPIQQAPHTVSTIKLPIMKKATASTNVNGEVELTASIDGQAKTITEASLRRHLKLEDNGGITSLPNTEIFEQLALMGYATDSDKLTFQKGNFSPQWRFFIHTILHCLSPKKTSWEQFSSNIATAIICLATNRTFNFSKFIFDAMVKNLDNPHKFLMYPRFIQICLNKQRRLLQPHTRTYPTPVLTQKVFNNMKRVTRGYSGEDIPLFPSMITAPETSPLIITSSPSLSPQHTLVSAPSTSPPPITETTPTIEEPAPMPHELPLQSVQSLGRDEGSVSLNELMDLVTQLTNKVGSLENELTNTKKVYGSAITKLVKRVKKLEKQVKTGKARRRTKIVLSEDEAVEEDSSKQGRSLIEELDMDADFSLVPPHDAEIQEKISDDTEVSTAAESLVYIRRSAKKKKDKGKAIVIEDESVQKKSKKQVQEERLEEYDKAGKKEVVTEVDIAHVINWNYPSVISNWYLIVPDEGIIVEALQTKYSIIGWEVHSDDTMQFWKIIRVGNHIEVYQVFEDMLKNFDRDDLIKLWSLVQERYNSSGLTEDKEIELWVELKMLFEPDAENFSEL
ncbi:hypothetical protein Tco_0242403 [Tanacetum coccineum]